jgi:type II secretory pathway component GspD/PulD (secretin)
MNQSVPMQWVQSANSQSNSISSGGTSVSSSSGGGITYSVQRFDVGQSITVTPRWPGGKQDATVEVDVRQADMAVRNNADMPRQTRNQLNTKVTTPLGQGVTIAATGNAPSRQRSFSLNTV